MTRARIMLADNHKGIREQVKRLLCRDFEVLGVFEDGQALVAAALELRPDLCVLDISMPILNGIEAAKALKDRGSTSKIILLTIHEDHDFLQAAFKAGATGYVVKRCIGLELREAIEHVLSGKTFISAPLRSKGNKTSTRLSA